MEVKDDSWTLDRHLKRIDDLRVYVLDQYNKHKNPSLIGHKLRDQYNVRIPKLCKVFNFNQTTYQIQKLQSKLHLMHIHLFKNPKDIPTKRSYVRLKSKLRRLQA